MAPGDIAAGLRDDAASSFAMTRHDPRGNAVSTDSSAALDAGERALWRMMSFYGTPLEDLDIAIAADPAWSLPHAMKAGFLLSLTEPSLVAESRDHLDRAATLAARGNEREQGHVAALRALATGDWQGAAAIWDELVERHPRDALALQWAHLFDFYRGDAPALEGRIAGALPAWSASDPLRPFVVAMHAFGLEEQCRYGEAEAEGRAALDADARVPWAIHAVAHVMEMQGRYDEGRRWMADRRVAWGEGGNGFSGHLGWHEALFALEALDHPAALALFDRYLAPEVNEITLQRVDAASLLWRLALQGEETVERFRALLAGWPLAESDAGQSAFNDLHVVLARIGASDLAGARAWSQAARDGAERGGAWNRAVMCEVGNGLLDGVVAYGEGRFDLAAETLVAASPRAIRIGGSHAQRDVIAQTLLAAAARGRLRDTGRALLDERRRAKPTPLNAAWARTLA